MLHCGKGVDSRLFKQWRWLGTFIARSATHIFGHENNLQCWICTWELFYWVWLGRSLIQTINTFINQTCVLMAWHEQLFEPIHMTLVADIWNISTLLRRGTMIESLLWSAKADKPRNFGSLSLFMDVSKSICGSPYSNYGSPRLILDLHNNL